jgi:translation initiation factor IF-3
MPVERGPRRNNMIRISPIRLIDENGGQVGIVETSEALALARERGLDLVEVSPDARPPVCKLLDFGKHKYEKNAVDNTPKEVRFRPNTGKADMEVKLGHAKEFLEDGHKVRLTVRFRGAEMRRQDVGRDTLRRATDALLEVGKLDTPMPEMQGRMLSVTLSPGKK